MACWYVAGITADERGCELPGAFEFVDFVGASRVFQPPMRVQFVLDLPRRRIRPLPAGAEHALELFEGGAGMLVELDRKRGRLEQILLSRLSRRRKRGNRRAEYNGLRIVGGASCVVLDRLNQKR